MTALPILLAIGLAYPHSHASAVWYASPAPALAQSAQAPRVSHPGGRTVSSGQNARSGTPHARAADDSLASGPMEVFVGIQKAWNEKNVDDILRHFGKGKVTISIEGTGPQGGQFSKNQSYYLLKDLFKYTITRKFEFVQYRKPDESEAMAKSNKTRKNQSTFAVAERYYQRTDDGRLFKDKIYVSLHMEEDRWVIDEIKSIR